MKSESATTFRFQLSSVPTPVDEEEGTAAPVAGRTNLHKPIACCMFSVLAPFSASAMPWKQSSLYARPTISETTGIGSWFGRMRLISLISACVCVCAGEDRQNKKRPD